MPRYLSLLLIAFLWCSGGETYFDPDGRCGYQNGGALCDPSKMDGPPCCSISGFCGSTSEYCLVSSGCQLNCTTSHLASSSPPTASPSSSSKLSGSQLSGVIAGSVISGTIVLCAAVFFLWKCFKINAQAKVMIHAQDTELAIRNPRAALGAPPVQRALEWSGMRGLPGGGNHYGSGSTPGRLHSLSDDDN